MTELVQSAEVIKGRQLVSASVHDMPEWADRCRNGIGGVEGGGGDREGLKCRQC